METAVMGGPTGGLHASGEVPGTGKVISMTGSTIGVDTMIPSRERSEFLEQQLKKFNTRSISSWRRNLSEDDRKYLERLVKKTTNASRLRILTSGDARGLTGYLRHASIPDFPEHLHCYAMLTNASIKSILRAL